MKILLHDKKPILKFSPDHWFGFEGVITFAYKPGIILWGENQKLFENGKVVGEYDVVDYKLSHRKMMEIYSEYTGKTEDKNEWIRGRTNSKRTGFNLWGHIDEATMKRILTLLLKYKIIKKGKSYEVGMVSRNGSIVYEIKDSELGTAAQSQPHAAIRQHIYKQIGLENKFQKAIKWLIEKLLK